ncbi:hypothetical protein Y032_0099g3155 [Ancylostoma ceylanicum]|uniref:Uncharacterized protein n=1 Tax=Ancylostoma ceylanicum TaxID=53326 RepID=A0A016TIW2_9BILA|nr:hypothetical protein Y032_0099g3155 [Ancylostoma ceylanicum]
MACSRSQQDPAWRTCIVRLALAVALRSTKGEPMDGFKVCIQFDNNQINDDGQTGSAFPLLSSCFSDIH